MTKHNLTNRRSWLIALLITAFVAALVAAPTASAEIPSTANAAPTQDADCAVTPVPAPTPAPPPTDRQVAKNNMLNLAKAIKDAAALDQDPSKAGTFVGWFVSTVTNTKQTDPNFGPIMAQLDNQRTQMDQLQKTMSYVCTVLDETETLVEKVIVNQHMTDYQNQLAKVRDVEANTRQNTGILIGISANKPGEQLTPQQATDLARIRTESLANIETLNEFVGTSTGGGKSLFDLHGVVIEDYLTSHGRPVPSTTGLYYTDYLHAFYDDDGSAGDAYVAASSSPEFGSGPAYTGVASVRLMLVIAVLLIGLGFAVLTLMRRKTRSGPPEKNRRH